MKVLVIGAKGMLGQEFMRQLHGTAHEVVGWSREDLDITDEAQVMQKIGQLKPDVVINCAAYNNVDKAEDEPEVALAINGEAPGYLARAAAECGATFVHFSTDYVFGGEKHEGYREDDPPNPISKYGESKALGEKEVLEVFRGSTSVVQQRLSLARSKCYIIRTSKLFGPSGSGATSKKSFPEIMIKIAREKGRLARLSFAKQNFGGVEAVDAEAGSPTYVKDLAEAVLKMMDGAVASGIYHLTNSGSCTWYEYAKAALKYAGLTNVEVVPVGPDHFPRQARRPAHVILLNTKLLLLRPWREALKEFLTRDRH